MINLVEYSRKNLLALNAATVPPLPTSTDDGNSACSEKDDTSAVESLMQLFVVKLEAAKANSGMEEDLAKLNSKTIFHCILNVFFLSFCFILVIFSLNLCCYFTVFLPFFSLCLLNFLLYFRFIFTKFLLCVY